MSFRRRYFALAGAGAVITAGGLMLTAPVASAAPTLSVTLSSCGSGWSAQWDSSGNPALHVGAASDTNCPGNGTFAEIDVNGVAGHAVPVPSGEEPAFSTDHYAAGSPRWVIFLSNGHSLWGYPPSSGLNGTSMAWAVDNGNTYTSYATAYNAAGAASTTVKDAFVVADADQAPGTVYTITGLTYGGNTLPAGADVVTVANPGSQSSTAGVPITPVQLSASSSKGDGIASFSASGLPAGLSLDSSTGKITGTPTAPAGNHVVTVTATDNGGTVSSPVSFAWNVQVATVTPPPPTPTIIGPGEISTFQNHSGSCLDNAGRLNVFQPVIIWRCGSSGGAHQQFELYTLNGRTTLRTLLNGKVMCVTTPAGNGNLVLGVCSDTAATQTVVKTGSVYKFPGDGGRVMDLKGMNVTNGNHVIAYPLKTPTAPNQQWSLP